MTYCSLSTEQRLQMCIIVQHHFGGIDNLMATPIEEVNNTLSEINVPISSELGRAIKDMRVKHRNRCVTAIFTVS